MLIETLNTYKGKRWLMKHLNGIKALVIGTKINQGCYFHMNTTQSSVLSFQGSENSLAKRVGAELKLQLGSTTRTSY